MALVETSRALAARYFAEEVCLQTGWWGEKRWILSLHLHLQGGKKHAWERYLWSLKKLLLKTKGSISLKLPWLPIETWLQCMSICLATCPDYLLSQLTNSSWSWWSNRCLSFVTFGSWTEARHAAWGLSSRALSWPAWQPNAELQRLPPPSQVPRRKCRGEKRVGGMGAREGCVKGREGWLGLLKWD